MLAYKLVDGATVFLEPPEAFGKAALELVEAGASVVGGCCVRHRII